MNTSSAGADGASDTGSLGTNAGASAFGTNTVASILGALGTNTGAVGLSSSGDTLSSKVSLCSQGIKNRHTLASVATQLVILPDIPLRAAGIGCNVISSSRTRRKQWTHSMIVHAGILKLAVPKGMRRPIRISPYIAQSRTSEPVLFDVPTSWSFLTSEKVLL